MLDITKLLQSSISIDRQMTEQKDILLSPEARQINAMTTLDVELAKLYQLSHWNEVWHDQEAENLTELTRQFVKVIFFLYGAYFEHRQADFKHAWHLLLKLGLVDLKLDDQKIMISFVEWQAALLKR